MNKAHIAIEWFNFEGAPVSFEDENGDNVKISHTIRGYVCRTGPHTVPVKLGDAIITKPFFKVVSAINWKKIEEGSNGTE